MNHEQQTELIQLLDRLEAEATYVDVATVQGAWGHDLGSFIEAGIVLVDYRHRLLPSADALEPRTVCRLNRRHPLVRGLCT